MSVNTDNTRYGKNGVDALLKGSRKLFFVGIGGINMSSLAVIAASRGYEVAGSDRTRSHVTDDLEAHGIRVYHEHAAENVADADALIYTVSIPTDNPEYVRAGQRGIPRISRADFLGWLMSRDVCHPIVSDFREEIEAKVMEAYYAALEAAGAEASASSGEKPK